MPGLIAQELTKVQPMTAPAGSIFTMNIRFSREYRESSLYMEKTPIFNNFTIIHTSTRAFMHGDEEPNIYYRSWLEEFVGEQGISWNWRLNTENVDKLEIDFADNEHAMLFELKWQ